MLLMSMPERIRGMVQFKNRHHIIIMSWKRKMIETAERENGEVVFYSDFDRQPMKLKQRRNDMIKTDKQPQELRYPFLSVCAVFSCVQTMNTSFGIVNLRTHVGLNKILFIHRNHKLNK